MQKVSLEVAILAAASAYVATDFPVVDGARDVTALGEPDVSKVEAPDLTTFEIPDTPVVGEPGATEVGAPDTPTAAADVGARLADATTAAVLFTAAEFKLTSVLDDLAETAVSVSTTLFDRTVGAPSPDEACVIREEFQGLCVVEILPVELGTEVTTNVENVGTSTITVLVPPGKAVLVKVSVNKPVHGEVSVV